MTGEKHARVRDQNRRALEICRQLLQVVQNLEHSNSDKLLLPPDKLAPWAVALLFAKAVSTHQAILLLVAKDFAEDAMVLARSLANLCFNLAYIAKEDSEERARDWSAAGRVARRQMAEQFGRSAPDAEAKDWPDVIARERRWTRGGAIKDRATATDNATLYDLAYRHGSTYEHSDAWSVAAFEPDMEHLRDGVANLALLIAAFSLHRLTVLWGEFFKLDMTVAATTMESAFVSVFPWPADTPGPWLERADE